MKFTLYLTNPELHSGYSKEVIESYKILGFVFDQKNRAINTPEIEIDSMEELLEIRNKLEEALIVHEVKGRRGISDWKVICDTSNNTGEFVADIYIKPAKSINFIKLS